MKQNNKRLKKNEKNPFFKKKYTSNESAEHKFKNTHCCNTGDNSMDFEAIIEHHPCKEGCRSCYNSKLSIKLITIGGNNYTLKYVDNKPHSWSWNSLFEINNLGNSSPIIFPILIEMDCLLVSGP